MAGPSPQGGQIFLVLLFRVKNIFDTYFLAPLGPPPVLVLLEWKMPFGKRVVDSPPLNVNLSDGDAAKTTKVLLNTVEIGSGSETDGSGGLSKSAPPPPAGGVAIPENPISPPSLPPLKPPPPSPNEAGGCPRPQAPTLPHPPRSQHIPHPPPAGGRKLRSTGTSRGWSPSPSGAARSSTRTSSWPPSWSSRPPSSTRPPGSRPARPRDARRANSVLVAGIHVGCTLEPSTVCNPIHPSYVYFQIGCLALEGADADVFHH